MQMFEPDGWDSSLAADRRRPSRALGEVLSRTARHVNSGRDGLKTVPYTNLM